MTIENAFAATRRILSAIDLPEDWRGRINVMVDVGEAVWQKLLAERERHQRRELKKKPRLVDKEMSIFIDNLLDQNDQTRNDGLIIEDLPDATRVVPSFNWLVDPVDNTDAYVKDANLEGANDFGLGLMLFQCDTGEVIASLFLLPAHGTVFLSVGSRAYRDAEPLKPQTMTSRKAVVRRPRKWEEVPQNIKELYTLAKALFQFVGYQVDPGKILTALDVLSLAEHKEPAIFLYYAKGWDFLIAASVAHAVGAKVTYQTGEQVKQVFPLSEDLISKASRGERVLFLVGWPE